MKEEFFLVFAEFSLLHRQPYTINKNKRRIFPFKEAPSMSSLINRRILFPFPSFFAILEKESTRKKKRQRKILVISQFNQNNNTLR